MKCWNHPETEKDKVFMGNIHDSQRVEDVTGWKQVRVGNIAYYNRPGHNPIPNHENLRPMFVKAKEITDDGFIIEFYD